jgi:hypothetical protein
MDYNLTLHLTLLDSHCSILLEVGSQHAKGRKTFENHG